MRNTQERVHAVEQRATQLKKQRTQRIYRATVGACGCVSLALIVLLAHVVPTALEHRFDTAYEDPVLFASVFSGTQALNYVVVGSLSFLLGVSVTLLCAALRKKRDEDGG